MRRNRVCSLVVIAWLGLAAIPAQACQPATYYHNDLQDPDEPGIDAAERDQREARVRGYLQAQAARRAVQQTDDAAAWSTAEPQRQADWLVRLVVPDPVQSDARPCVYGPFPPQPDDAVYRQYMDRLHEDVPPELGLRAISGFMWGYQDIALGCNRELNQRLVPALLEELPPAVLRRVVGQIALTGFHPAPFGPEAKLFRHSAGPGSALELIPRTWQAGGRPPIWEEAAEAEFNERWPVARAFWQTDRDALAALAATRRALDRLSDPARPYSGYCPQTVERIAALAQDQRDRWPQMVAELPEDVRLRAERRRQRNAARGE